MQLGTTKPPAVIITAFLMPLACATVLVASPPDLKEPQTVMRLRELIKPFVDGEEVQGISVGVIIGDQSQTFHFGTTAKNGSVPNDKTLYEIGSISKVFTGILLADAVANGDLTLDQPAGELLPDGAKMPATKERPITLRDLSTHRSGLPRLPNNMPNLFSDNPYANYTSDLALEFLSSHELARQPGTKGEYSNYAVSLLGHLLCLNADQSYESLMQDRIAGPLEMDDTTITQNKSALERLATGHFATGTEASSWEFADLPGAGGIRSSLADMMRFARANLTPPDGELGRALELAWKQQAAADGYPYPMGLGWHLDGDGTTHWHNGQTGGYHSMLMVNRQLPAAVVVLSNTGVGSLDGLARDIMKFASGGDVKPTQFTRGVDVPAEKMMRCEGRYQLAPGAVFDVKVTDGQLIVKLANQPALRVFAKSDTEWFYKVVKASLTFSDEQDGQFQQLELFQNGIRQTAKRIK